jgi:gp51
MKYKVIVYYDNMEDSVHVFHTKNEAINEMHRLGLKYRNSRMYTVEMQEVE